MKTLCQQTCGSSPTAHMCSAEEVIRLASVGALAAPHGWYSTGTGSLAGGSINGQYYLDCNGWTSHNTYDHAIYWAGQALTGDCSDQRPALCCD